MKEKNTNWKIPLIIVVGVIAVILMGIFWVQGFQNKAINYEEQVNTAQSDIKVQEKRRVDLVYNLADCVKQYDKHEAETLKAVVDGRSSGSANNENTYTIKDLNDNEYIVFEDDLDSADMIIKNNIRENKKTVVS